MLLPAAAPKRCFYSDSDLRVPVCVFSCPHLSLLVPSFRLSSPGAFCPPSEKSQLAVHAQSSRKSPPPCEEISLEFAFLKTHTFPAVPTLSGCFR